MTDKKKRAISDERLERLKDKLDSDPEARKRAEQLAASVMGAEMAKLENDVEIADDVPPELREAFANGYMSEVAGQLAAKPSWFTDVPLIARAVKLARSSLTDKEREVLGLILAAYEPPASQELIAEAERRALEKLRKK